MMSQALKATFSGFTKEQQRLGIPKGKTATHLCSYSPPVDFFTWKVECMGLLSDIASVVAVNHSVKSSV